MHYTQNIHKKHLLYTCGDNIISSLFKPFCNRFFHAARETVNAVMVVARAVQTVMPSFVAVLKLDWFQKTAKRRITQRVQNTHQTIQLQPSINQTKTILENMCKCQQNLVWQQKMSLKL